MCTNNNFKFVYQNNFKKILSVIINYFIIVSTVCFKLPKQIIFVIQIKKMAEINIQPKRNMYLNSRTY